MLILTRLGKLKIHQTGHHQAQALQPIQTISARAEHRQRLPPWLSVMEGVDCKPCTLAFMAQRRLSLVLAI